MVAVLCVGLGGFIGSVGRYLLGLVPVEGDFPLMTFTVNFAGAVLIGAVFEAATEGSSLPDNAVLFLKTGVCGGFTTF
ncbi:CrcB-like protein, partial [Eggerthella sp. 1_3_56FAA]